jgi:hypothetical protein
LTLRVSGSKEAGMNESMRRRNEFGEALRNVLAQLKREGVDRVDRARVEELGQRYGLDPDEARSIFADSEGTIWQGELVESAEEPGWEAAMLERVPPAAPENGI